MEVRGIAGSDSTRPGIDEGIDEGIDGGGVALQSKGSSGLSGEPEGYKRFFWLVLLLETIFDGQTW
jgi:hypothetical protein